MSTASHRAVLLKNGDHVALLQRFVAVYGDSTMTIFVKTPAHFAAAVICRRLLLRDLPIQVCHTNSFERKLHADDRPLVIQHEWSSDGDYSFVLMKRPPGTPRSGRDFPLRRSVSFSSLYNSDTTCLQHYTWYTLVPEAHSLRRHVLRHHSPCSSTPRPDTASSSSFPCNVTGYTFQGYLSTTPCGRHFK